MKLHGWCFDDYNIVIQYLFYFDAFLNDKLK